MVLEFFELRGIGRSPQYLFEVRRSVSGLFSNPPGRRQTGNLGSRVMPLSPGCSPPAAPAEPGGDTFRLVVRQFSGYFYFSRWPGGMAVRRL